MTSEEKFGLVPDLTEAIEELDYLVLWKKVQGLPAIPGGEDEVAEPRRGIDIEYDKVNDKVSICK